MNSDVYKAMNKTDIKFASNIGIGIFKPSEIELEFYSGCHEIESCFELPVLTYCDINLFSKRHLKLLTIAGSSWEEIRFLLLAAAQRKLDYVVILTHPFEFIKNKNTQYTTYNINKINKKRFDKVCHFLQHNNDKFSVTTFSDLQIPDIHNKDNTLLKVPHLFAIKRMVENYVNDLQYTF